jgi:hypothetical protein
MPAETAGRDPVSPSAMKWLALPIALAASTTTAAADGEWRDHPALIEWSTWVRLGVGVASQPPTATARAIEEQPRPGRGPAWETGLGVEMSLPAGRRMRIGAWAELQNLEGMGGLQLLATRAPADLDLFAYHGEGVFMVRAGGNRERATAAVGWGYRCPWKLWGPFDRTSRYHVNVRFVASGTTSRVTPGDWTATFGIEFEPIGSIRYLFGIHDWYRTR